VNRAGCSPVFSEASHNSCAHLPAYAHRVGAAGRAIVSRIMSSLIRHDFLKRPSILDTVVVVAAGVYHRLKSWKTESFSVLIVIEKYCKRQLRSIRVAGIRTRRGSLGRLGRRRAIGRSCRTCRLRDLMCMLVVGNRVMAWRPRSWCRS
jgi:hypothetical protein